MFYKPINSLKGYEISTTGKVRNTSSGKELKQSISRKYPTIATTIKGKSVRLFVHRLLAETYLGEIPKGYCVNHKDGNKLNNDLSNLEVVTNRGNCIHAIDTGLTRFFSKDLVLKLCEDVRNNMSKEEIKNKYNISSMTLSNILRGKTYQRHSNIAIKHDKIPRSKISDSLLFEIRKRISNKESLVKIAKETGVSYPKIGRIFRNETYKV